MGLQVPLHGMGPLMSLMLQKMILSQYVKNLDKKWRTKNGSSKKKTIMLTMIMIMVKNE